LRSKSESKEENEVLFAFIAIRVVDELRSSPHFATARVSKVNITQTLKICQAPSFYAVKTKVKMKASS